MRCLAWMGITLVRWCVIRPRGDLGLYGQATKRIRWMPWQSEAMKDVAACEKCRGAGNKL